MSSISIQSPPASPGSSSQGSPHYSPVHEYRNPGAWNRNQDGLNDGFALSEPRQVHVLNSDGSANPVVSKIAAIFSRLEEIAPENTLSDGGGSPRICDGLLSPIKEKPEPEGGQKLPADFMFRLYPIPK